MALVLAAWQVFCFFIPETVLPPPLPVLALFARLFPGQLVFHTLASLGRTVLAVALAALVAVPAGIFLGRNAGPDKLLSPAVYVLYPIPKIAFLPVLMLLLGIGNAAKVAVVFLVVVFQMLITVRDAARAVPREYLDALVAAGAGRLDLFRFVLLPAVLPAALSSVRVASGTSLAVLFFAETFFSKYGLGFFIVDAWMRMDYPRMFAGIVDLGLLGLAIFLLLDILDKALCPWKKSLRDAGK
jgi:NitT/TauT family transport system permease protein